MSNGDYEEAIDEAEDQIEDQQELGEAQVDSYGTYPTQKQSSDIYNWFWKVVRLGKLSEQGTEGFSDESIRQTKVGNLSKEELGAFNISIRDALNLANLGQIFGHPKFGNYWESVAIITSASSMAKKGWFMDLSISQKKVRERARKSFDEQQKKWKLFGKKKSQEE